MSDPIKKEQRAERRREEKEIQKEMPKHDTVVGRK